MTVRLEELLAAAPPAPWAVEPEARRGSYGLVRAADGKTVAYETRSFPVADLIALAPDAVRLLIDMGKAARDLDDTDASERDWEVVSAEALNELRALLARLDRLGT